MNKLQITAIVVTIAIITPIGLGFLMAVEEVDRTGWESTSSANLSELMLNSETEYYTVSNVPLNNAEIIVNDSDLKSPVFNSAGSVITSLPEYTTTNTSVIAPSSSLTIDAVTDILPSSDRAAIVIESNGLATVRVGTFDGTPSGTISIYAYGGEVYIDFNNDSVPDRVVADGSLADTTVTVFATYPYSVQATLYDFTSLPISGDYSFRSSSYSIVRIVADGTTTTFRASSFAKTSDIVTVGFPSLSFSNVTSIEVATPGTTFAGSRVVSTQVAGSYGNPAYGWTMPGIDLLTKDWINGQLNRAVEFYLSFEDGESIAVMPWMGNAADQDYIAIAYSDNMTTISVISPDAPDPINLGNYPYVRLIVRSDGFDVAGIPEWPPMGGTATIINSWSYDLPSVGDFARVRFLEFGDVNFRVDSATIVAGTFPIAKDYSLDLGQYWPGASWALTFPNIGVYGDSITFGGNLYTVENGRISMSNGRDISLLDATLSGTYTDGIWTYSINNVEQATSADLLPVVFSGVWSVSVTGYKMEQITETTVEWIPGEFALDSSGFVLAALIGVGLAFFGLALYGRRSGSKTLWLLVICGAVAFIFISMI